MCIAINADFGQLDQCCITSVAVHGLHKLASHLQAHAPVLVAEILGRRFGDIVAEIQNDRNLREPLELLHRNGSSGYTSGQPVDAFRHFALGKHETSRFIRHDRLDLRVLHGSYPTRKSAGRMGNEDMVADTVG